ncbi:hypothetical protein O0880_14580 [Janthinobacterium sp. SUN118]|uniref:hypothetical protein n=1 Tax=Janthinobacterium sp. SUN118 TaxID=3004100 RepID=UPI0025B12AE9|nr:hypothetical protein [Janthinobacterium sp. SUN118]MDN2710648.1 hypothetical protein [Janthinobacterium sp. SUN118]
MANEKHPAEIALALLRDYPEHCDALGIPSVQFRQYARPIIDAYFASLGEKLCRKPVTMVDATPEQLREWETRAAKHERDGTGAYTPRVPRKSAA